MADAPEDARLEQLERRVRNDPMSVAFAALAEEYRRAGRLGEAIETCRAGLTRHPAYLSARVTLGRALMESGALEEAEAELQRVVTAAPENLAAIRCLAEIHKKRGPRHATEQASPSAPAEPPPPGAEPPVRAAEPAAAVVEPPAPAVAPPAEAAPAYGQIPPPMPAGPVPEPPDDPVIADLEEWLAAIVSARRSRDEGRSAP